MTNDKKLMTYLSELDLSFVIGHISFVIGPRGSCTLNAYLAKVRGPEEGTLRREIVTRRRLSQKLAAY